MVLAQLGESLVGALARMAKSTVVDDKVVVDCLNDVSRALLQADVRFVTVRAVQASIRSAVNLQSLAAGTDRRRAIKHAVVDELRRMLYPATGSGSGKPPCFLPRKGKKPASVVMFVGLQGSGKTTTSVKYADYHRRTGFSPALVCADTFRAGALDQLRQNAAKAGIPFYGSYTESDPVRVAVEGVDRFRNDQAAEGCDLIVVDTSGRHSQEAALLEMRQLATVKGASFTFTLRALYSLFRLVQSMGPLGRLVSFLPAGLLGDKGKQEKEGQQAKIKRYMTIMDSMSAAELDGADPMKLMMTKQQQSRINRVARGSGRPVSQ